jgi:hypothetical protein
MHMCTWRVAASFGGFLLYLLLVDRAESAVYQGPGSTKAKTQVIKPRQDIEGQPNLCYVLTKIKLFHS